MENWLEVTERGIKRFIPGEVQGNSGKSIVKDVIDGQNKLITGYLSAVTPKPEPVPTGYSNPSELKYRNIRFFVTIGAYVGVSMATGYGIIWLVTLTGVVPDDWFWPLFILLSGLFSLVLIKYTHESETIRTPEGIELERVHYQGYETERRADGLYQIASAIAESIAYESKTKYQLTSARLIASEREYDMNLSFGPLEADDACKVVLDAISAEFDRAKSTGTNLISSRLPWSQRGSMSKADKDKTARVLGLIDPPIFLTGSGGRWLVNTDDWVKEIAISAVKRRWILTD